MNRHMEWGDARVWYGNTVPLCGKVEALRLLNLGVSNRTERGAIRPCSGLNTPLFCHSGMAKILVDRQKSKSF